MSGRKERGFFHTLLSNWISDGESVERATLLTRDTPSDIVIETQTCPVYNNVSSNDHIIKYERRPILCKRNVTSVDLYIKISFNVADVDNTSCETLRFTFELEDILNRVNALVDLNVEDTLVIEENVTTGYVVGGKKRNELYDNTDVTYDIPSGSVTCGKDGALNNTTLSSLLETHNSRKYAPLIPTFSASGGDGDIPLQNIASFTPVKTNTDGTSGTTSTKRIDRLRLSQSPASFVDNNGHNDMVTANHNRVSALLLSSLGITKLPFDTIVDIHVPGYNISEKNKIILNHNIVQADLIAFDAKGNDNVHNIPLNPVTKNTHTGDNTVRSNARIHSNEMKSSNRTPNTADVPPPLITMEEEGGRGGGEEEGGEKTTHAHNPRGRSKSTISLPREKILRTRSNLHQNSVCNITKVKYHEILNDGDDEDVNIGDGENVRVNCGSNDDDNGTYCAGHDDINDFDEVTLKPIKRDGYSNSTCKYHYDLSAQVSTPSSHINDKYDVKNRRSKEFTVNPTVTFLSSLTNVKTAPKDSVQKLPIYKDPILSYPPSYATHGNGDDICDKYDGDNVIDVENPTRKEWHGDNKVRYESRKVVIDRKGRFMTPICMDYASELIDPILDKLNQMVECEEITADDVRSMNKTTARTLLSRDTFKSTSGHHVFVSVGSFAYVCIIAGMKYKLVEPLPFLDRKTTSHWKLPTHVYERCIEYCVDVMVSYIIFPTPPVHIDISRFSDRPISDGASNGGQLELTFEFAVDFRRIVFSTPKENDIL